MTDTNTPFISIIVPIYQVEAYINQCVDSILRQSFNNYELILVDDGSSDGCPAMCDKFAANDKRIKVIHKTNGGLSDARNAGIQASCGQYLLFIDSDDFITEGSLLKIEGSLKNDGYPDVLFLNAKMYFGDGRIEPYGYAFKKEEFYGVHRDKVLKKLSSGRQFHVSACVKAVKKELIMQKRIFFTKNIVGEDVDFSIKLYMNAVTFSYLDYPYYYYRQERGGSIMAQKNEKRFYDLLYIIQKWTVLADGSYKKDKQWILCFLFHQYYILVSLYKPLHKGLKKRETKASLNRLSYLLRYTGNRRVFIIYMIYLICGLDFTSYCINRIEGI